MDFKQPDALTFCGNPNLSESFRLWKQKFSNYLLATGKNEKSEKVQVAILLTCIGDDGLEIFNNFIWETDGDNEKIKMVLQKFEDYCNPRKNTVIERYKFWNMTQEDMTFDEFLTDLMTKARNCEFGEQKDMMIRDRVIFGIKNINLKERLLRDSENPSLERVIELCRAAECSKQQLESMNRAGAEVDALEQRQKSRWEPAPRRTANTMKTLEQPFVTCEKCGTRHKKFSCPAYGKRCNNCKKYNHFAKKCSKSRRVHEADLVCSDEEECVGEFKISATENSTGWYSLIKMEDKTVKFKLDTGAEANIIPKSLFYKLKGTTLRPTNSKLITFSQTPVTPLGKTKIMCQGPQKDARKHELDFYVMDIQCTPLLGLKACKVMNLVQRVDAVDKKMTLTRLHSEHDHLFQGLGKFEGKYHIDIDKTVSPVVNPPRNVPFTIMPKLKIKLEELVEQGVLVPVQEATDWVSSLVVTEKKNGDLRLCLDPKDLNKAVKRQHFKIPTLSDITSQLSGKTVFTILDEKDGYHHVELDDESSYLCTFQTPFGRYRYTRLPFGLKSSSEVFQQKNMQTFGDIEGVYMIADDMIIAGKDEQQHDEVLKKVLRRAEEKNIRFNKEKLQFKVRSVKYMENIVSENGLKPDPDKVRAIVEMPPPEDKKGVQRLLGTVNYLASYIPNMSEITTPLRALLHKDAIFEWRWEQENAMEKLKRILTSEPVLKFYDVNKNVTIQTDSSQSGIGCCLLQDGHPIAYSSRALTDTEKRYAQIEKELLSVVFACGRFSQYIWNKDCEVITDHRPLEAIMKKPLNKCPPRLQRMLLQLQRYTLTVKWSPGKYMYVADTLSRAYLNETDQESTHEQEDHLMIHTMLESHPFSKDEMKKILLAASDDQELFLLKETIEKGWPDHMKNLPVEVKPYWNLRDEIHVINDIVFVGDRVVIPHSMRKSTLEKLHESHLGLSKMRARATGSMFWPKMNKDITQVCEKCATCNKFRSKNQKEPLLQHEVPERAWQKCGADIFHYRNSDYLIVCDYFSKFVEIRKLYGKTAKHVQALLLAIFAVNGICEELISDNMPFNSTQFKRFAKECNFKITTTSPTHSQSNGQVERQIQTVKKLLKKAYDSGKNESIALLEYRNTPISGCDYSPAQLLFNRRLRDKMPTKSTLLMPKIPADARDQLLRRQREQKSHYDTHTRPLSHLMKGDSVRYWRDKSSTWEPAVVQSRHQTPRSYNILTENGQHLRRNRVHLQKTCEPTPKISKEEIYDPFPNCESAGCSSNHPSLSDNDIQQPDQPGSDLRSLRPRNAIRKPARYREEN